MKAAKDPVIHCMKCGLQTELPFQRMFTPPYRIGLLGKCEPSAEEVKQQRLMDREEEDRYRALRGEQGRLKHLQKLKEEKIKFIIRAHAHGVEAKDEHCVYSPKSPEIFTKRMAKLFNGRHPGPPGPNDDPEQQIYRRVSNLKTFTFPKGLLEDKIDEKDIDYYYEEDPDADLGGSSMDMQLRRIIRDPNGDGIDPGYMQNVELIRLQDSKPVKGIKLPDGDTWRYDFVPDNTEWKLCANFKQVIYDSILIWTFLTPKM